MALEFNNTAGQQINCNFATNFSAFTIMAWIRPTTIVDLMRITDKYDSAAVRVTFRFGASGELVLEHTWTVNDGTWISTGTLAAATSYHVAVTYNNTATTNDPVFYIDGAVSATIEVGAPTGAADTPAANWAIGNRLVDGARPLNGQICGVKLYNRVLTAAEIVEEYASRGRSMNLNGLQGFWPLNELAPASNAATGSASCKDRSSNGRSGTPSGTLPYRAEIAGVSFPRAA